MNETTPDDEPEHIGRASQMWRWRPFAPRPLDVFDELTCLADAGKVVFLFGPHSNSGITPQPSAKPAPVAELTSLTDDTPPSTLGLDGVFYVYEP